MSLHGGQGGSERDDGDHDLCGVYYAIVTQNDDADGSARVKVRYPWLDGGDSDQSFWAPICVPMCGDQFGTYTLPEIEDTVIVMFLAGDVRYPVVIGGAWSEVDPPPEVNEDGNNDFRLIKSRSGHRFLLDDSDSPKLVLTDKDDKNLLATGPHAEGGSSKQNKYGVPSSPDVSGNAEKGISLSALDGTLNILCPAGTFSLESKNGDVISKGDMDIKAGSSFDIQGGSASISSSGGSKYEGSVVKIN